MAKHKKKSNRLIYIMVGVVVALLILALVGKSQGWIGGDNAKEVELAKAKKVTIIEKVSASGAVQPVTEIKLSPDVAGEITELNVEEGDSVKMGQLLIRIRPDNLELALDRTRAMLNQQRANLSTSRATLSKVEANFNRATLEHDRQKLLFDKKVISKADWEMAEANFIASKNDLVSAKQSVVASQYIIKSQQASVNEAAENLRLANVYAPASGTVSKLSVEQGERVVGSTMMAGTEMLRIADLTKMEVRVDVNENDIIRVSLGDTAVIDVDAYSHLDKKFKGVVTAIANTANDKISSDAVTEFQVKIRVLNDSFKDLAKEKNITSPFRPGMTASVDIITERKENVLSVPLSSVTTRDPNKKKRRRGKKEEGDKEESKPKTDDKKKKGDDIKEVVFINNAGKAKMVEVKTGISDFDNIEILEGVKEGDEIVSGPFLIVSKKLDDDDDIKGEGKNDDEDKEEE